VNTGKSPLKIIRPPAIETGVKPVKPETTLKPSRMVEKQIEQHLVRRVKEQGGRAYKWVSPGTNGVPDRIVILPGGRVLAVECKRPGGRVTRLQQREIDRLTAMGLTAVVVDSIESIDRLMEKESA